MQTTPDAATTRPSESRAASVWPTSTKPGELTFPVIQKLAERILLVSDAEIRATVRFLLGRMKILVEPSGAAAAAAVLFHKLPPGIRSVGVVLSGGNVDL